MSVAAVQLAHAEAHPVGADFCWMCDPARWIVGDPEGVERVRNAILKYRAQSGADESVDDGEDA